MAKDRDSNKGGIIITLFIAFIMVTSVVGFIWGSNANVNTTIDYNKTILEVRQDGIYAKVDGKLLRFDTAPSEADKIAVDPLVISRIKGTKMIYTTYDFNSTDSEAIAVTLFDFHKQLDELYGVYSQPGFTKNSTYGSIPIVTCATATQFTPVLYFFDSNTTEITMQGNCILMKADTARDYLRLKDRILYSMAGII